MEIELSRYCGQVVGKLAQTVRLKALRIFVFMIIYVLFVSFLKMGRVSHCSPGWPFPGAGITDTDTEGRTRSFFKC